MPQPKDPGDFPSLPSAERLHALSERRAAELAATIEHLPVGIYLGDAGGIRLTNRRGLEMLGFETLAELGAEIATLGERIQQCWPETGERIPPEEMPFARALAGEFCTREVMYVNVATGEATIVDCAAAPLRDAQGRVVSAVAVNTDVTARWRAEQALRQRERTVAALVEHAPDPICRYDRAFRHLYVNPAQTGTTGIPMDEYLGRTSREIAALRDILDHGGWEDALRRVFESGEPGAFEFSLPAVSDSGALRRFQARLVPEVGDDGAVATVLAITQDVTEREQAARLLVQQRRIAEVLQRSLLETPANPTALPGLEVATFYESASDEARVGGDFFDVFRLDASRIVLVVGDVTGKGLAAATSMAEVKFALRALIGDSDGPSDALGRLNRFLLRRQQLSGANAAASAAAFVCLALAVLDTTTGELQVAAAGAEPPLILRGSHGASAELIVRSAGPPLGVDDAAAFMTASLTLSAGDVLALFTDGFTEARRRRPRADDDASSSQFRYEFFGCEGMADVLRGALCAVEAPPPSLEALIRAAHHAARAFAGGSLSDDACLLLARRLPD